MEWKVVVRGKGKKERLCALGRPSLKALRRALDAGVERIICEVDRIDQIGAALSAGAHHLLLDNMGPDTLREADRCAAWIVRHFSLNP